MTEKTAVFTSAIASIEEVASGDFKHPFLTIAKFIFADDRGNTNRQGIEYEDFPEVAQSAIGMPVKMAFTGTGTDNHTGSVPIGHINAMDTVEEDGVHKLIATAALWPSEYPEEITYLKEAYAAGKAPGISWELAYETSIKKAGIEWLKSIVTKAATFVRTPAYGSRTHLMALAAANDGSLVELVKEVLAQVSEDNDKGGNNEVTEEEIKQMKQEAETLIKEAAKANGEVVASKDSEIERLTKLVGEKDGEIQKLTDKVTTMEQAVLIEARTKKIVDAGITLEADAEKLTKKKSFWASLTEEAFEEYLSDLVAAKASGPKGAAASSGEGLPRMTATANGDAINFDTLKSDLKKLARSSE